jgi:hypothetical protein
MLVIMYNMSFRKIMNDLYNLTFFVPVQNQDQEFYLFCVLEILWQFTVKFYF